MNGENVITEVNRPSFCFKKAACSLGDSPCSGKREIWLLPITVFAKSLNAGPLLAVTTR
jgi:hypothetical protein